MIGRKFESFHVYNFNGSGLLLICSSSRRNHYHVNLVISRNILRLKRLMPRDETKSIGGKHFSFRLFEFSEFGTVSALIEMFFGLVWLRLV